MNGKLLIDANVLIYGARTDVIDHAKYKAWFDELFQNATPFVLTELTAAAFLRIVTNPRAYRQPHTIEEAIRHLEDLASRPFCSWCASGPLHWGIFRKLWQSAPIRANLVNDAWLAALAIENDCDLISADRDFARFQGLRWRHPLDPIP